MDIGLALPGDLDAAVTRGEGIQLTYAPAILYPFPGIPQWIGRMLPTCHMLHPVVALSRGAGLAQVRVDLAVLA